MMWALLELEVALQREGIPAREVTIKFSSPEMFLRFDSVLKRDLQLTDATTIAQKNRIYGFTYTWEPG